MSVFDKFKVAESAESVKELDSCNPSNASYSACLKKKPGIFVVLDDERGSLYLERTKNI